LLFMSIVTSTDFGRLRYNITQETYYACKSMQYPAGIPKKELVVGLRRLHAILYYLKLFNDRSERLGT
jgi:hypothetical protein